MASLDDILSAQKNGVVAINGLRAPMVELASRFAPSATSDTIAASTTTLIVTGSGRLAVVSIPVSAGTAIVSVYDSATTGGIAAGNCIYASLSASAAEFSSYQDVSLRYRRGLVVVTGAGMNANVSYTPD
jgi:hypothetical protein